MLVFGSILGGMLKSRYNNHDFEQVRCAAHVLNLAVSDGMKVVSNSIIKLRNFASHIRRSQPIFEKLKKIFEMNERPFLVPDLDVPTRWNSTYIMIEKLCRIREMTDILITCNVELKDQYPTEEDWNEINVNFKILLYITLFKQLMSFTLRPFQHCSNLWQKLQISYLHHIQH